ncbi:MAG TPA: hypothetical protein VFE46_08070 [Pirellulales bacterium]|jgi:hypothetical protein|nr:hypothetical protein [Pirellulales bacterium]
MSFTKFPRTFGLVEGIACAVLVGLLTAAARADEAAAKSTAAQGNVEFDYADAPPAAIELDLSQGMFHDLFGIGDAAVAGVADALAQSTDTKSGAEGAKMATEQLAAARQIVQLFGQLVQGARVRIYQGMKQPSDQADKLLAHYDGKLHAENWQCMLKARQGDHMVTVWVCRSSGAIKGVFVEAACDGNLVLANVVSDISPENVEKLSSAATSSALHAGLGQMIEAHMRKFQPAAAPSNPHSTQP